MGIKKEVVSYLIFGILTTLVNIISYGVMTKLLNFDYKLATTYAWILSVLFAFITNKLYVFNSRNTKIFILIKEAISFLFFRLLSYFVDIGMMIFLVELIQMEDFVSKIIANVIVVIINYFASRYIVFKSRQN